ncbi:MAG: hypothetical protein IPL93_01245 [Actinomycetales bacterium]|nr:hypothetical protein [Actinomycetales bacterium]
MVGSPAALAGWTPFGWAWAIPRDVADGRWGPAAAKLVLRSFCWSVCCARGRRCWTGG